MPARTFPITEAAKVALIRELFRVQDGEELTAKEFARHLGCSAPTLWRMRKEPTRSVTIDRVAAYLCRCGFDVEIQLRPVDRLGCVKLTGLSAR